MKCFYTGMMLMLGIALLVSEAIAASNGIADGSQVAFDYTLTVDGKVVDTSAGKQPLNYTQGDGKLIPGLTKQMAGMKVGEERSIEVKPEDAYGTRNPDATREVPMSQLPAGLKPVPGMMFQAKDAGGRIFPAKISEVKKDSVIMDFNHPLAGKTLFFKIKIVSIK